MKRLYIIMLLGLSGALCAMENSQKKEAVELESIKIEDSHRMMPIEQALTLLGVKKESKDEQYVKESLELLAPKEYNDLFKTAGFKEQQEKIDTKQQAFVFRALVKHQVEANKHLHTQTASLAQRLSQSNFFRNVAGVSFLVVTGFTLVGSLVMLGVFSAQ